MSLPPTDSDWKIRQVIYACLVATGCAPDTRDIAARFDLRPAQAQAALQRLHDAHALVLADDGAVLMAHPLSAVQTDYRARIDGRWLYANCAWDSLGIPAMLGDDAQIEALHPLTRQPIRFAIRGGQLVGAEDGLVHFAQPFRHWYDDIVET